MSRIGCGSLVARFRGQLAGRVTVLAAATLLQAALAVALLPIATTVLSAGDFGVYGLLLSFVALVSAVSDGGAGLVMPAHYGPASAVERARLFASFGWFAGCAGTVAGLSFLAVWPWRHTAFSAGTLDAVPFAAALLTALLMPLRAVSQIMITTLSLTGRGIAIASQIVTQSITGFLITILGLFVLHLGVSALFLGVTCGQLAALLVGTWAIGADYVLALPSRRWLRLAAINAPVAGASGLMDGLRVFAENAVLTRLRGLDAVGYFGHARLYHGLLTLLANSVGHNVWARSLAEARDPVPLFAATGRVWAPVQFGMVLSGLVFVFAGHEIVDLITNGKLTPAAAYIPAFIIICLIQNTGKAALAVVYAAGKAARLARFRVMLIAVSLAALYPATTWFGIAGVVAVALIDTFAYRVYLRLLALGSGPVPFQDQVAAWGVAAIAVANLYALYSAPSLATRLSLMAMAIVAVLMLARRTIGEMLVASRQLLFPSAP
jgi:O-antigen/teichoic acid export membrane protein